MLVETPAIAVLKLIGKKQPVVEQRILVRFVQTVQDNKKALIPNLKAGVFYHAFLGLKIIALKGEYYTQIIFNKMR
jgi:hypothetical protein